MLLVFLFLILSLLAPWSEGKLVKRSLASYPLAKCNDGTPANYYYTDDLLQATKLLINLEGGGACSDKDDCVERSILKADIPKYTIQIAYWLLNIKTGVQVNSAGCAPNSPTRR